MNHPRRRFRPGLDGSCLLEERVVPSQAAVDFGNGPLDAIRMQYIRQFEQQFASFASGYAALTDGTLFAGGDAQIAANRPAFDQGVLKQINQLTANLSSLLSLSPMAGPSGLTPQIQALIAGDGPDSLVSQLDALASPTDTNGTSAATFGATAGAAVQGTLVQAVAQLNAFFSLNNPMRQAAAGSGGSALQMVNDSYVRQFQRAFADFSAAFSDSVNNVLFAGGVAPTAAGRTTFDQQVLLGLNSLNNDLTAMLALSPRSSAQLLPQVQDLVIGSGPNSLATQLAALATPTDVAGQSAFSFGVLSSQAIDGAFRQALRLLDGFFGNPNRAQIPVSLTPITFGPSTGGTSGTGGATGTGGTSGGATGAGSGTGGPISSNTGSGGVIGGTAGGGNIIGIGSGVLGGTAGGTNIGEGIGQAGSFAGGLFDTGFFGRLGPVTSNLAGGENNNLNLGSQLTQGAVLPISDNTRFALPAGGTTIGRGFLGVGSLGNQGAAPNAGLGFEGGFGNIGAPFSTNTGGGAGTVTGAPFGSNTGAIGNTVGNGGGTGTGLLGNTGQGLSGLSGGVGGVI